MWHTKILRYFNDEMMDEINKEKSQHEHSTLRKIFSMANMLFFNHYETVESHSKAQKTKQNH